MKGCPPPARPRYGLDGRDAKARFRVRLVALDQRRRAAKLWALLMAFSFLAVLRVALACGLIAVDVNY